MKFGQLIKYKGNIFNEAVRLAADLFLFLKKTLYR